MSTRHVQAPPFVRPHTADTAGKQPGAAPPGDDVRAAEDRAGAVVRQLEAIGFRATGLLSGQQDLVKAVRAELRARHYSEVIAVTGQQGGWITRLLGVDPVRRLQRRLGRRLVVFPVRTPAPQVAAAADRPERAAS